MNRVLFNVGRVMIEWISVKDQLPGNTIGTVLVVWQREYIGQGMPKPPTAIIQIGMYDHDTGCWLDAWIDDRDFEGTEEGGVSGGEITHWRLMTDLYKTIPVTVQTEQQPK